MGTVNEQAEHIWAKTADGRVRCGLMGCQAKPSAAEVVRLEAELATAARMRTNLDYRTVR